MSRAPRSDPVPRWSRQTPWGQNITCPGHPTFAAVTHPFNVLIDDGRSLEFSAACMPSASNALRGLTRSLGAMTRLLCLSLLRLLGDGHEEQDLRSEGGDGPSAISWSWRRMGSTASRTAQSLRPSQEGWAISSVCCLARPVLAGGTTCSLEGMWHQEGESLRGTCS